MSRASGCHVYECRERAILRLHVDRIEKIGAFFYASNGAMKHTRASGFLRVTFDAQQSSGRVPRLRLCARHAELCGVEQLPIPGVAE